MSGNKHLPLKLAAPARVETADGWSINLPWARHGDDDPYAEAEAFTPLLVDMVNSYASSQAEIERLTEENATLRTVATKIDADWTEAFPGGPEGDRTYLGGFGTLSDDTVEVWRVIRAALSGSKE